MELELFKMLYSAFSLQFRAPLGHLVFLYGQAAITYALYLILRVLCDVITYLSFSTT
jgi:hypothetical protein